MQRRSQNFRIITFALGKTNNGRSEHAIQVILDSLFARPGSAPVWGGKKGEFRDWFRDVHYV